MPNTHVIIPIEEFCEFKILGDYTGSMKLYKEIDLHEQIAALNELIKVTETLIDAGDYSENAYPIMFKKLSAAKSAISKLTP